jgi:hypothetical protein
MEASAPVQITASRGFYIPPALLALPVIYFGTISMQMAMRHHPADAGLLAIGAIIALAGCALFLNSLMHLVQPPRLRIDGEGLFYANYRWAKHWAWGDIYALSMAGGCTSGVSLGWNEAGAKGPVPRRLFLDKSFLGLSGEPKPLYDRLVAAQTAAIGAPQLMSFDVLPFVTPAPNPIWRSRAFQFFVFLFCIAHVVSLIDFNVAGTELIAPTNRSFVTAAAWLGGIITFAVIVLAPGLPKVNPAAEPRSRTLPIRIILAFAFPLASAGAYGHLAWRIEELAAFEGSTAPFLRTKLRVEELSAGKGGPKAWVNGPEGDIVYLPISARDYDRFPDPYLRDYEACYPVYLQREGKVGRISKPATPAHGELRLTDCPRN